MIGSSDFMTKLSRRYFRGNTQTFTQKYVKVSNARMLMQEFFHPQVFCFVLFAKSFAEFLVAFILFCLVEVRVGLQTVLGYSE